MADHVKIPGLGEMPKKWLYVVGAASAVIIGYAWWHKKRSHAAAPTPSTDPGIDPSTGQPYSTAGGGYPSLGGYYSPGTGATIGTGIGSSTPPRPTSNASWFQECEAYLASLGYNPLLVASALGKYLAGRHLTSDEAAIVQAAIGAEGYPPNGAPAPVVSPPPGYVGPPKPKPKPHPGDGWTHGIPMAHGH